MKPAWHLIVSFRTELLSIYLLEKGYRHNLSRLLPKVGLLRNYMIVDNDIYVDQHEVKKIAKVVSDDLINLCRETYSTIETVSQNFIAKAQELVNCHVKETSNADLAARLKEFFNSYQDCISLIGIPTVFDLVLVPRIKDHLIASGSDDPDEALRRLTIASKPLGTFQESHDLLKLAMSKDATPDFETRVIEHAGRYGWLHSTLFLGDIYKVKNVIEEIEKINGKAIVELEKMDKQRIEQVSQAEAVIKTLTEESWQEEARLLQEAVYYRTARLEWMNEGCYIVRPLLEEAAQRLDLEYEDILYLFPEEIEAGLQKGVIPEKSEVSSRRQAYALVSDDIYETKLYINEALADLKKSLQLHSEDTTIKGITACKGIARGRVVIVKDRTEIDKVSSGDILVTKLTTPDFIVAMKKAAAIVTDLGGLTSHAAIVAREIGVPCIVGTNNATTVLKDGDEVEVDADKGIVTIISKK